LVSKYPGQCTKPSGKAAYVLKEKLNKWKKSAGMKDKETACRKMMINPTTETVE
jgi:hypothetical protein